mmetsp:Transcript_5389/g.9181  ORF Transcript_5389/g.9181 Transcript_5389/m.9181 type:complete len:205 (+) Transcript_5389:288-902(+)
MSYSLIADHFLKSATAATSTTASGTSFSTVFASEATATALAAHLTLGLVARGGAHARRGGARLLLVRVRHVLFWQVEVLAHVLDALVVEVPVEPLPVEGLCGVALGHESLHELHHLDVGHIDLVVLRLVEVLWCHQATLLEEVGVHRNLVCLLDKHDDCGMRKMNAKINGYEKLVKCACELENDNGSVNCHDDVQSIKETLKPL